ncbi:ligand-binding sensor domain-containing protein [Desulfacinum infernum]|uniref:ligand-binding sensor domain-containing protein n=1 Tax=Desulfacinum infernum TaxID=35837 RepID=UPI0009345A16|nr:two-component regulator propeller domain-containing protein [Desulfacinum infernum]
MKAGIRKSLAAWSLILLLVGSEGGAKVTLSRSPEGVEATAFSVSHVGPGQGLSHSQALSILQDRVGFLWVGTRFGLNRFDAYECVPFFHDGPNPKGPGGNVIWRLMEDSQGRLWIATWG